VKVAIVSEFYPRAHDPVLGIWAHRQAVAARDAGADVRVVVLHRPIPPRGTSRRELLAETRRLAAHPRWAYLDGIEYRAQVERANLLARARHQQPSADVQPRARINRQPLE